MLRAPEYRRSLAQHEGADVDLVHLVYCVDLVHLVDFVDLVGLVHLVDLVYVQSELCAFTKPGVANSIISDRVGAHLSELVTA